VANPVYSLQRYKDWSIFQFYLTASVFFNAIYVLSGISQFYIIFSH